MKIYLRALLLTLLVVLPASIWPASASAVGLDQLARIDSITVDYTGNTITISGENLGGYSTGILGRLLKRSQRDVAVSIGGEQATVIESTSKRVVVALPALPDGTYRVTLDKILPFSWTGTAYVMIATPYSGGGGVGPIGPIGPTGADGAPGEIGPMGPVGPQGEPGLMGPVGPQGEQGEPGPTGPIGPMGPAGQNGQDGDTAIVGTIISSLLQPAQYASEVGDPETFDSTVSKWAFADGRDVAGSKYAEATGDTTLPDLRGMFLRGLNAGRADGLQDPDGVSRKPGDLQEDQFQGHGHLHELGANGADYSPGTFQGVFGTNSYTGPARILDPRTIAKYGDAKFGTETRPKNIAVNYYIRIN